MRRACKRDANHAKIVKAFRDIGASVLDLGSVGKGCPDILVGWRSRNFLVEIKNLEGRGDRLTDDQRPWHAAWAGQVVVATSIDDAVAKVALAEMST